MTEYILVNQLNENTVKFVKGVQDFGKITKKAKKFYEETLFKGFDISESSNKYIYINRVSNDEDKIIVKFSEAHIFKTRFGYGLRLSKDKGIWLKDWQVQDNYFTNGYEVVLDKNFYNVVDFKESDEFGEEDTSFEKLIEVAKLQQVAKWEK